VLHVAAGECVVVKLTNHRNGARVSFHADELLRTVNSSGINVGFNPEQTLAPGETRTYRFYAPTAKTTTALISDYGGDMTGRSGLYGAVVVAPAGATFTNPDTGNATDVGAQVDVHVPGGTPSSYRDFSLIFSEADASIGQNHMPYPIAVEGGALVNYRTAGRVDSANGFSSTANGGDPPTPLLQAYAGDPVKVHALGASDDEQMHILSLGGQSWSLDPGIPHAQVVTARAFAGYEAVDADILGGAGGWAQAPGDYTYADMRRPFTQAGMWGLMRVLPTFGVGCPIMPLDGGSCGGAAPSPTPVQATPSPLPATPTPAPTTVPAAVCQVPVAVVALPRNQGYYVTFTTAASGPVTATWTLPVAQRGELRLYAGNPFSGIANPSATKPLPGQIARNIGVKATYSVNQKKVAPGTYTLYFFDSGPTLSATTAQVSYMKSGCP
jgi:hypothetical protein